MWMEKRLNKILSDIDEILDEHIKESIHTEKSTEKNDNELLDLLYSLRFTTRKAFNSRDYFTIYIKEKIKEILEYNKLNNCDISDISILEIKKNKDLVESYNNVNMIVLLCAIENEDIETSQMLPILREIPLDIDNMKLLEKAGLDITNISYPNISIFFNKYPYLENYYWDKWRKYISK